MNPLLHPSRYPALDLDPGDDMPLTHQLSRAIQCLISNGSLSPGDKLPHEVAWSEHLGISRWTLRAAIAKLVDQGLLYRVKHAGTFVRESLKRSRNIGFFYYQEAGHMLGDSLHHIQGLLDRRDYDLKVVAFPQDYYAHVDLPAEMQRRELAGAVLVVLNTPECLKQLQRLDAERFPYVRMGNKWFTGRLRAPLITGDDSRAVQDALDYLRQLGHERIGYIAYRESRESSDAYLELADRKLPGFTSRWFLRLDYDGTLGAWRRFRAEPLLQQYLRENPEITAVIAERGSILVGLLQAAQSLNRAVPDTLSVLSLTEAPISFSMIDPAITHMKLSRKREAELAVAQLLQIIESGFPKRESVIRIPFAIIEGASVALPPAHAGGL